MCRVANIQNCKACLREHISVRLGEKVCLILCLIYMKESASLRKAQGRSAYVIQPYILRCFLVITRLLVDELAFLPGVLNQ